MRPAPASKLFIPMPADVYGDLGDGLTPTRWCVLSTIYRQVDFETGLWKGSADKIVAAWQGSFEKRTVQRTLEDLHDLGYIKSFRVHGRHGNYPVAIEGYQVRFGPHSGHALNAKNTTNPAHPVYELCNFVSPKKSESCHRGDESDPRCHVGNEGTRNSNQSKTLEANPQCHATPKATGKSAGKRKRVTEESGVRGNFVSPVPDSPEQQQHTAGGDEGENNPANPDTEFLVEVYRTLDRHGASHEANRDHQKKAVALAAEHGPQVFLQALDHWLVEDGAKWQKKDKRWALGHFVISGKCELYINRARLAPAQNAQAAAEAQRKHDDDELERKRQAIKADLTREEDAARDEFADWQAKHGTADGFVPSDRVAFERYVLRERVQRAANGGGESWAALSKERDSLISAAIVARLRIQ
jgi:hypothetical protein